MNNRKAINLIRHSKPVDNNAYCLMLNEAFDIAIQAIEELEEYKAREEFFGVSYNGYPHGQYEEYLQYKSLGTLEQVHEAVDRMKAKQVIKHKNPMEGCPDLNICPTCKRIMVRTEILGRTIDEHCVCCGQAIDFGDGAVSAEDS